LHLTREKKAFRLFTVGDFSETFVPIYKTKQASHHRQL
jgi:peptidoglycan biosynthesis protein MviN/MurJ (putative lipid II flippase)